MPRASKAVDAAKKLGRKVAATGAAKSVPKAAAKAAKTTDRSTTPAKRTAKVTKDAKPKMPVKAAPAPAPAKAVSEPKPAKPPAKRLEGAGADKFFEEQRVLLLEERISYLAQAADLKAEADQLAQEMEPGDIQFDDESGEGATAAVDRERDLALSAQARVEVDEIDHALAKLDGGSYGICEGCGQPVPRARLKALPHARLCVACKSGGLSRR
ncbi:MAG TPA: TraR/DksA C4-type zinc finger protein [Acidimicrobiales bacterium]|nr:TraR/DksA C4-type zinc finger protein [Acidimicrobiales bacterium]